MNQHQPMTPEEGELLSRVTQVWLLKPEHFIEYMAFRHEPRWPDSYELVSLVETDSLSVAFALTQGNLYVQPEVRYVSPYGGQCDGVDEAGNSRRCVVLPPRSTSVGDVLVTPDGRDYRVASFRFERIG